MAIGPILFPDSRVVLKVMLPGPDFLPIKRPKNFCARFAPASVSDLMLDLSIVVIIGFLAIKQIPSMGANPCAPLRPDFTVGIGIGKSLYYTTGCFRRYL